jgi:hypothetical protein
MSKVIFLAVRNNLVENVLTSCVGKIKVID